MANAMVVVERSIHAMGGDVQTQGAAVVGRSFTTLSLPCASFRTPSTGRSGSRLASDRAKAVEESEAGRDVLEEFRDVVLDGGAIVRGCEQVFTVLEKWTQCTVLV